MIRIAIIDSREEYRKELYSILNCQDDFEIIGLGKDGYEAVRLVDLNKPDVILLDIDLPYADGVKTASLIKSRSPSTAVVVFSDVDDYRYIFNALHSGVSCYLSRKTTPDFLSQSIRTVYFGGSLIAPEFITEKSRFFSNLVHESVPAYENNPSGQRKKPRLPKNVSVTELRVIGCVGKGLTNREIAEQLKLREGTVRNYISSVLQKTGLRDRTQLAIFSIQHGF
ncbi:MAG: response regulator transcription factor [Treponema sp.]|jgi:DNA-binding NarL/FixJ family response regulator|nr:response regulator transcription factor [Treponema sp.]